MPRANSLVNCSLSVMVTMPRMRAVGASKGIRRSLRTERVPLEGGEAC